MEWSRIEVTLSSTSYAYARYDRFNFDLWDSISNRTSHFVFPEEQSQQTRFTALEIRNLEAIFMCLTSMESPIKREVIFDREVPLYRLKDSNKNITVIQPWYQSWFIFVLIRGSMLIKYAIHTCFTTNFPNNVVFIHSTNLWTARAITAPSPKRGW